MKGKFQLWKNIIGRNVNKDHDIWDMSRCETRKEIMVSFAVTMMDNHITLAAKLLMRNRVWLRKRLLSLKSDTEKIVREIRQVMH